jgi:hypothetical protein
VRAVVEFDLSASGCILWAALDNATIIASGFLCQPGAVTRTVGSAWQSGFEDDAHPPSRCGGVFCGWGVPQSGKMTGFEGVRKGWSTETHVWGFERPEVGRKTAYVGVPQKSVGKVAPMSRGLLLAYADGTMLPGVCRKGGPDE